MTSQPKSEAEDYPEVENDTIVAMNGMGQIVILGLERRQALDRGRALRMAAWIVALADTDDEFPAILDAVRKT